MTIPKLLHYCWFGRKEVPNYAKKKIKTLGLKNVQILKYTSGMKTTLMSVALTILGSSMSEDGMT